MDRRVVAVIIIIGLLDCRPMDRRDDLDQLYEVFVDLEERLGGMRRLRDCTGYMNWPDRGVYVFFANAETRGADDHPRVTRVGTHAVSTGSETTLWDRLIAHRGHNSGSYAGGGNHRGSVFRKRVGEALIKRDERQDEFPDWGAGSSAARELRLEELPIEQQVSEYIRDLPFLWVAIDDEPGPDSDRAFIERNAIALLSNYRQDPIDKRDEEWLGRYSPCVEIRESGLWNVNHVDEEYDPSFLDRFERSITQM